MGRMRTMVSVLSEIRTGPIFFIFLSLWMSKAEQVRWVKFCYLNLNRYNSQEYLKVLKTEIGLLAVMASALRYFTL